MAKKRHVFIPQDWTDEERKDIVDQILEVLQHDFSKEETKWLDFIFMTQLARYVLTETKEFLIKESHKIRAVLEAFDPKVSKLPK